MKYLFILLYGFLLQMLIWYLFPVSGFLLVKSVGFWLVLLLLLIWLVYKTESSRFYKATLVLSVIIFSYLCMIITPAEEHYARPADEIRSAAAAWIGYDEIPQAMLFEPPNPPYAVHTAALHRHQDEKPEYSWELRFINPYEAGDQTYLLNIRNNQVGTSYPAMMDADIGEEVLVVMLMHDETPVAYFLDLDDSYERPYRICGHHPDGTEDCDFEANVHAHYLSVSGQPFQQLFWGMLNRFK